MAPDTTVIFSFPQKAPDHALIGRGISALKHLELWKIYKENWTEHNPSITVSVRDDEWPSVAAWVYENWDVVGGISFLPHNDHVYQQAPYESLTQEQYEALVAATPKDINWSDLALYELTDHTIGSQEPACSAGECEVVDLTSSKTDVIH